VILSAVVAIVVRLSAQLVAVVVAVAAVAVALVGLRVNATAEGTFTVVGSPSPGYE